VFIVDSVSPKACFSAQNEMHHKVFGGQAMHEPAGGAHSAPPDSWLDLEGRSGGREGRKRKGGEGRDGEGRDT